jgi:hypothetical protein
MLISPTSKGFVDLSRVRNVSAVLSPCRQSVSTVMPSSPIHQILNLSTLKNQNESYTALNKASRLSSGLNIIRETKRENSQNE